MGSDAPARPKRILVVDDEHVIADTLRLIFQKAGYEAQSAYNGRQAVECARTFRPDVVVSDVVMPEMDGIDAVTTIASEFQSAAVLLISGQADGEHIRDRIRQRYEIVAKPIHPEALLEKIAHLTAKAAAASA